MKIAIFTEVLEPYVCGISSYVEVLRSGLISLGHKVIVITSSLHTQKSVIKGGVIRCAAVKCGNKYGYECKNINDKLVGKILDSFRPDVIHIQTDTKIGYMGLAFADRLRCPVVFSVHDYIHEQQCIELVPDNTAEFLTAAEKVCLGMHGSFVYIAANSLRFTTLGGNYP